MRVANGGDLRYSLRFLSGRAQGNEYVLDESLAVVVGRSGDANLILIEGMVSRHHARFALRDQRLYVEDLDSTNGTFVNGKKIKKRVLKEGDRVLIGTSILKVVRTRAPLGTKPPPPDLSQLNEELTAHRYRVSGDLEEVSVPELLEPFNDPERQAVIEIHGPKGLAYITVSAGRIEDCTLLRLPDAPATKALLRVMGFNRGTFAVQPYDKPKRRRLDRSVAELLVDGLFKLDELEVLRQRLPGTGEKLLLARPLVARLSELEEADLDVVQLAHNVAEVDAVMDQSPETDLEVAKRLLALLDQGYLRRG